MLWGQIEFWINRYQTLLAAALAVVGVFYATRPVWRQVAIMEAERTHRIREALALDYSKIDQAKALLSFNYVENVQEHRLDGVRYAPPEYLASLREGHAARRRDLADRRAKIAGLALPADVEKIVVAAFDKIADNDRAWCEVLEAKPDAEIESSGAWFTYLEQPQTMMHSAAFERTKPSTNCKRHWSLSSSTPAVPDPHTLTTSEGAALPRIYVILGLALLAWAPVLLLAIVRF